MNANTRVSHAIYRYVLVLGYRTPGFLNRQVAWLLGYVIAGGTSIPYSRATSNSIVGFDLKFVSVEPSSSYPFN